MCHGDRQLAVPRHIVESPVGRLDNPTADTRLPAGPASPIQPGWQVAVGCLPPPWACRRLSSPRGTTPSGHQLLPGPVGDCPAHPGPHRQATGGHTIMPPRPIPPIQGGDSPNRLLPCLVWHLSPC
ncbi:hypothetical protein PCASD_16975 [Puccinia coronata f. sp. avenae]|uniref:Uncharacterized protein n=1 Tax=Puccinia coronata f. sp. avenae TaxID=200324 RepID=A0A2N5U2Y0_9BASI|nr:hypothetical protein PCASD_16975 [Puccinia coronata f. sp. avenae]